MRDRELFLAAVLLASPGCSTEGESSSGASQAAEGRSPPAAARGATRPSVGPDDAGAGPDEPEAQNRDEPPVASGPDSPASDPAIAEIDSFIRDHNLDLNAGTSRLNLPKPPKLSFTAGKTYHWHIETNLGALKIELDPEAAPQHVSSTIYLSRLGFYDGLIFHRILTGFMAQGGCPLGDGSRGPGYQMKGEFLTGRKHDRAGLLSTANAGPGTDGSQFFLTFAPKPHLDARPSYTICGDIVEGMETLRRIEERGIPVEMDRIAKPRERVVMERTWITVE